MAMNGTRTILKHDFTLGENMRGTGRTHDDCDGDLFQRLELLQGDDGDMHISTDGVTFLRFRMPVIGGGLSEHTYDALKFNDIPQLLCQPVRTHRCRFCRIR